TPPLSKAFKSQLAQHVADRAEMKDAPWLEVLKPGQCADLPPLDYVVKDILAPGNVACLYGAPGAGNSMLGPYVAYMVALGERVFDKRTRKGKVLYIAAEDPSGLARRVRALHKKFGDTDNFDLHMKCPDFMADDSPGLRELFDIVARDKPK